VARKAFYSFHYKPDNWRASQVRNMGKIEGNQPASDNNWQDVTAGGDARIKKWIASQMYGRSCTIVLIGAHTAKRKWIDYEIRQSWDAEMGVLGIYVHNLLDRNSRQSTKGRNPFDHFTVDTPQKPKLSSIVKAYDPPFTTSTYVYGHIKANLADWVEEAIAIRKKW
jgi:hypothetical protein